jgi:hypothetical protein
MVEQDSPYELIWPRAKLCKMYIKIINKNNYRWLWYEQGMVMTGGYDSTREGDKEGSKGLPIPNNSSISL